MVARDLGTKHVTSPTLRKENPDYDENGDNPKYIPAEPHLGSVNNAEPKPKIVQTGWSKGGTTNPPEGESGEVQIVVTDSTGSDIVGHDQGDLADAVEDAEDVDIDEVDVEVDPYLEADES